MTIPIQGLQKIPMNLAYVPIGTRILPACSIYPDQEGWLILPPEDCTEESFNIWKDQLYNNAIDLGLKQEKNQ